MIARAWDAYRLRIKRRRFLLRAWRKSRQLTAVHDRTSQIGPDEILCFATVRNEALRLSYWLDHYRKLGVRHFLIVDNASDDGTAELLAEQTDVSVWSTPNSYKLSRFGMDWLTWLQRKHAHGHWALTVDADELLVFPNSETHDLSALTKWLSGNGISSFGAVMLDMYPKGRLSQAPYEAGQDPTTAIPWFDPQIRHKPNTRFGSLWIQGGVRDRVFFAARPERAPTLNKLPLVDWRRGYAYVTSTHHMLPRRLNRVFVAQGVSQPSGVLLHTKFLNTIAAKSAEELERRQHFENSSLYTTYYQNLIDDPDLWYDGSVRYTGPAQLEALGLMSKGDWTD
ncbi:glycosyltransferase family 2 protein [Yoonia sp. 208BN28-4]|uniref:glycosyltransferase family 2 protein n=1 Tax=Yoonia sp. 208BN28-4 TaxID=3126505 RepID=UPI0030A9DD7E